MASPATLRDALPNASFIGFTGTPIENTDKNTQAVFGDYIDLYDIQQAVEDGAAVRIFYENRLAKIKLKRGEEVRNGRATGVGGSKSSVCTKPNSFTGQTMRSIDM